MSHADGNFTYTPPPNFVGRDWFTYKLTDSAGDASTYGTVFIDVTPVPDSLTLTIGNTSDPAPSDDSQDTPFIPIDDGYDSDDQTTPNDQLTVPDATDPELVPASITMNTAGDDFWAAWTLNFPSNVRVFRAEGDTLIPLTSGQPSAAFDLDQSTTINLLVQGLPSNPPSGPTAATITATMTPVADPRTQAAPPINQPTTRNVGVNVASKPLHVLSVDDYSGAAGTALTTAQQEKSGNAKGSLLKCKGVTTGFLTGKCSAATLAGCHERIARSTPAAITTFSTAAMAGRICSTSRPTMPPSCRFCPRRWHGTRWICCAIA